MTTRGVSIPACGVSRPLARLSLRAGLSPMQAHRKLDMQDFTNDPDLEKLYEERMHMMRRMAEEKQKMQHKGHGQLTEVMTFSGIATHGCGILLHRRLRPATHAAGIRGGTSEVASSHAHFVPECSAD